jgi:hypothetical protein
MKSSFIFSNSAKNIDTVIASVGKHYEVTLDRDATSFSGLNMTHNPDSTVTITQPKLLTKLFALYPPRKDISHKPAHPNAPLTKESDPPTQPADHFAYLRLLGILLYLTKSRPAHSTERSSGIVHNRSVKQTAVATSSTHAEARAIFTLAKELNFLIALCQELQIPLDLPAIIMEDNSAVVTMANNDFGYTKKSKHFLMVLNYIKEQIALGQIEARNLREIEQRRYAHQATPILRLYAYGSQDPRPTCLHIYDIHNPYPTDGKYVRKWHGCRKPTKQRAKKIVATRCDPHI